METNGQLIIRDQVYHTAKNGRSISELNKCKQILSVTNLDVEYFVFIIKISYHKNRLK